MVGCSCRVGVATQAGSVRTRNGDTLNRTPLAEMWLIHRLVSLSLSSIARPPSLIHFLDALLHGAGAIHGYKISILYTI